MKWEEAASFCGQLLEDLDDLPPKAEDFGESVRSKVEGMLDWIETNRHVTDKMVAALENMQRGVDKWLHRGGDR